MKINPGQIKLLPPEGQLSLTQENPVCPDCGDPLSEITYLSDETKNYLYAEQVWYCPTCDYAQWGSKLKTRKRHSRDYF